MYLPEHFLEKDIDEIKRIIKEFPLATLITSSTNGLEANHLPFLVDFKNNAPQTLLGHIAIGNLIYKNIRNNEEVLVVYKAEDSYISPNWYPSKKKITKLFLHGIINQSIYMEELNFLRMSNHFLKL